MSTRTEKQQEASMRNLATGEQRQFNRAAMFGFKVGVTVVFLGGILGIIVERLFRF
jgi:hypothetical protein